MNLTREFNTHVQVLERINKKYKNISDTPWSYAFLIALLILLEFFRRPDALLNAQPWNEDGVIFLQQAISNSAGSIFIPYAGYYHAIPRLVTLFALQSGLGTAPFIMNFCAIIISVFCISYVFRPRFRVLIPNDLHRFFLAVTIACIPNYEIFLNITNIQWFLILFLALWTTNVVFNPELPALSLYNFFEMAFVVLAFFSCPLGVILIPGLLLGIALKIRDRKIAASLLLYIVPTVSFLVYCATEGLVNKAGALQIPSLMAIINMVFSQIFIQFFHYPAANFHYLYFYLIGCVCACVFIGLLGYAVINRRDYLVDGWIISLFVLSVLILAFFRPEYIGPYSLISSRFPGGNDRYVFFPWVLLLILLLRHMTTFRTSYTRYFFYALLALFLVNVPLHYELDPLPDYHVPLLEQGFDRHGTEEYLIRYDANWFMEVPANSTFIENGLKSGDIHRYEPINSSAFWVEFPTNATFMQNTIGNIDLRKSHYLWGISRNTSFPTMCVRIPGTWPYVIGCFNETSVASAAGLLT